MAAGAPGEPDPEGLATEPAGSEPPATSKPAGSEPPPTSKPAGERRRGSFLRELPVLLVIAFVIALLIKSFLVQAFYIPSPSMQPTLMVGDRVLVNKLAYVFHPPRRGDIIVFQDPHPGPQPHRNVVQAFVHWLTDGLGFTQSSQKDFIKRVIGLPGDTIEDSHGIVYVNGVPLRPEPYLSPIRDTSSSGPFHVPAGELFVMGDNRTDSLDSRYGLGYIPISKVIGRAFVVIWPPSRIRWLSTPRYTSGNGP